KRLDTGNQGTVGLGSTDQNLFTWIATLCQSGGCGQRQNQHQGQKKESSTEHTFLLVPFIANSRPARNTNRISETRAGIFRSRWLDRRESHCYEIAVYRKLNVLAFVAVHFYEI